MLMLFVSCYCFCTFVLHSPDYVYPSFQIIKCVISLIILFASVYEMIDINKYPL